MIPRLFNLWQNVRSSLWALPLVMAVTAVALAYLAIHTKFGQGGDPVWFLYSGDAAQAPQFLSDLVTAMLTMATLAISITMVVLALAAQQLGPRLIRSFMADPKTQIALGLFVSTVVYLVLVLRTTYGTDSVPNLAVTVGTGLVLLSIMMLLVFVHHLANSIVSDNAIARVGDALDADITRLLPTRDDKRAAAPKAKFNRKTATAVCTDAGGYVQAIDHRRIAKAGKSRTRASR
ncbi:MAG: DUF2254 family protein [Pseudolabrys sp.]